MGEAKRKEDLMRAAGMQKLPGGQIAVDLKNAVQKTCECGCKLFQPVVMVYTISALVSPTGQELTAQRPALICLDCKRVLGEKENEKIEDDK